MGLGNGLFPPGRDINVNFNWVDIATATGYVLLDGYGADLDASDEWQLIPSSISSDLVSGAGIQGNNRSTSGTVQTSSAYSKCVDQDFDLTGFQLPRRIQGAAQVRLGYQFNRIGTAENYFSYAIVKLRKWDGASETEIASVQSDDDLATDDEEYAYTLPIIVPLTHFKKGEILRLTVELWAKNQNNVQDYTCNLACDPSDAAVLSISAGNTRLVLAVPFKIDI